VVPVSTLGVGGGAAGLEGDHFGVDHLQFQRGRHAGEDCGVRQVPVCRCSSSTSISTRVPAESDPALVRAGAQNASCASR